MPFGRETEQALLKWVNRFTLDASVTTLSDLTDGVIFSKMLADIDPDYAVPHFDSDTSSKWLSKKTNLEAVCKALLRYVRDNCDNLDIIAFESRIDFNAMAEQDDTLQTVKLLTIFLMAAVEGPKKKDYIHQIMKLDPSAQQEIMKIIQEEQNLQERTQRASANNFQTTNETQQVASPHSATPNKDHDFSDEESQGNLYAKNEKLRKKHADFITRFERLSQAHADLLEHSKDADRRLASLEASNVDDKMDYIKKLQGQILEQNELIANQEQQAETDRVAKENYQKELKSLRPMAARLTECQDKLNEIKVENDSLARKANTVDHFQKKLELKMNVDRENATLRQRIDVLYENQKDYDKVFEENGRIKTTINEYSKRFEHQELNIVELSTQKNVLKQELQSLQNQLADFEERRIHDERFILELQEQIRTNATGPISPGSPGGKGGLNLEEELEQSDTPNYPLQISRLKAEIQLLKSNTAGNTNASLRVELEELERKRKQFEGRFQELFEQNAIAQQQLNAIASKAPTDKDESVMNTRKLYLETNSELTKVKTQLSQTQLDLTERDRELLDVKANLAAVAQSEIDAIDDLRSTNEIITSSLQSDLTVIRAKFKILQTDFEVQKNHLVTALVSKDALTQELASLKAGIDGIDDAKKAEEDLAKSKKLSDQIEKQDILIEDLQRKLKKAEEGSPDALKAASESMIKNLTRENALIATAWYDLSSRLQSNHVVLQRRHDAPKSWLNKQRMMVNSSGRK